MLRCCWNSQVCMQRVSKHQSESRANLWFKVELKIEKSETRSQVSFFGNSNKLSSHLTSLGYPNTIGVFSVWVSFSVSPNWLLSQSHTLVYALRTFLFFIFLSHHFVATTVFIGCLRKFCFATFSRNPRVFLHKKLCVEKEQDIL